MSGGEQQRVAIARLLVKPCSIILADEPTGNLDDDNKEVIFALFDSLIKEYDKTILMVTYDEALAQRCDMEIKLETL